MIRLGSLVLRFDLFPPIDPTIVDTNIYLHLFELPTHMHTVIKTL